MAFSIFFHTFTLNFSFSFFFSLPIHFVGFLFSFLFAIPPLNFDFLHPFDIGLCVYQLNQEAQNKQIWLHANCILSRTFLTKWNGTHNKDCCLFWWLSRILSFSMEAWHNKKSKSTGIYTLSVWEWRTRFIAHTFAVAR